MSISFQKQITDIKKKGIAELINKINTLFKILSRIDFWKKKIIYFPLAIIILILYSFISLLIFPFYKLRLGILHRRLGHFVLNTELYLLENKKNNKKNLDFWFWPEYIPNKQVKKMISRALRTSRFESKLIYYVLLELKKILYFFSIKNLIIGGNAQEDRDINNFLDNTDPQLNLTADEINLGFKNLKSMGLDQNKPIVCIIVRDSAYLNKIYPNNKQFWKKQDFRDSNINSYLPTAEYLHNRGYQIVRMGSIVKEKIDKNKNFIFDYANSSWRNDFMDVFLGYICKFTISNSTGWDAIPVIFRKPIVFVNHVPIINLHTYSKKYIHIFKHHFDNNSKKYLSLKDIIDRNLHDVYDGEYYSNLNIKLKENTEEEILQAAKEMIDLIACDFNLPTNNLEKKLWSQFPSKYIHKYNGNLMHGKIKSRFSNYFITKNEYLLSND